MNAGEQQGGFALDFTSMFILCDSTLDFRLIPTAGKPGDCTVDLTLIRTI